MNQPHPDPARVERNLNRLKLAIRDLAEHFNGIVILAHEDMGNGKAQRYAVTAGDPLALRYHAQWWAKIEETADMRKTMADYFKSQYGEGGPDATEKPT